MDVSNFLSNKNLDGQLLGFGQAQHTCPSANNLKNEKSQVHLSKNEIIIF